MFTALSVGSKGGERGGRRRSTVRAIQTGDPEASHTYRIWPWHPTVHCLYRRCTMRSEGPPLHGSVRYESPLAGVSCRRDRPRHLPKRVRLSFRPGQLPKRARLSLHRQQRGRYRRSGAAGRCSATFDAAGGQTDPRHSHRRLQLRCCLPRKAPHAAATLLPAATPAFPRMTAQPKDF